MITLRKQKFEEQMYNAKFSKKIHQSHISHSSYSYLRRIDGNDCFNRNSIRKTNLRPKQTEFTSTDAAVCPYVQFYVR